MKKLRVWNSTGHYFLEFTIIDIALQVPPSKPGIIPSELVPSILKDMGVFGVDYIEYNFTDSPTSQQNT